jgi:hypothetical protein
MSFDRGRGRPSPISTSTGCSDIVQVNFGAPVQMWRSTGSRGRRPGDGSLARRPGQRTRANHDAIGSWVEVKTGDTTIERELTVGGGHVSGRLGPTHFGLGSADRAEVRITWPDGGTGPVDPVEADQYVTLERGADAATPWRLP